MSLQAIGVSVRLGGRPVVEDATCHAQNGRITAVIGPNGAGKSTLLRAMAGLVPLDAGRVEAEGATLASLDRLERARQLAYLPQERAVHWPLSARSVVALGRLPHRASPTASASSRDEAAVAAAMQATDVLALADRSVFELSGGERARVLVARALAQQSRTLIADEPTAGLDPAHALALFATFGRLAAEGRAVLIALHDLTLAARFCHHVVLLVGGRVAASGSAATVLAPEPLSAAFGVSMVCGTLQDMPVVLPVALAR